MTTPTPKQNLCCLVNRTKTCSWCKKVDTCNIHKFCSDKCKEKYNTRTRKRQSYDSWADWIKWLKTKPSNKEILVAVHQELDVFSAYHSQTSSDYSKESLELAVEDNETVS